MLLSLALVFLIGLAAAALCARLRLPRIVGMLAVGMLLGPYALDLLSPGLLNISAELRQMALVIILMKAGLSLDLDDLRRVGRPAVLMSFLPALVEIGAFVLLAPRILGVTRLEGAIMGAVLGAVSPAVVVPRMVQLIEERWGTDRSIPQMILAGASLDDVFVIVLFTSFTNMAQGHAAQAVGLLSVPVAVVLGIALGGLVGWGFAWLFELAHRRGRSIRQTVKAVLLLGTAFLLTSAETLLEGVVPVSGLLAVMSMACVVHLRCRPVVGQDLSAKFGRLWIAAELLLFVLVGAAVDLRYTLKAGAAAVVMILLALVFRSVGVLLCMVGTPLDRRERLFCVIAYLPKATVQAAIGGVPLALGLPCGPLVLSVAVLSILLTAPLGALGMDLSYRRLLRHEEEKPS